MKKSQKILLGTGASVLALAAVAAVAGPIIYREYLTPTAAETPSLNGSEHIISEEPGKPLDPAAIAGAWHVSDGSEAGYRVDEKLSGSDVTVTGRTSEVTGDFQISADGRTLEAATITVDVDSISTDSAQRDAYFREQALRTGDHPEATFVLADPVTLAAVPGSGEAVTASALGDLTLTGEARPVTADVTLRSDGTTAQIVGTVPITFADFGVPAPSLGFVTVEPEGFVEFELEVVRSTPSDSPPAPASPGD